MLLVIDYDGRLMGSVRLYFPGTTKSSMSVWRFQLLLAKETGTKPSLTNREEPQRFIYELVYKLLESRYSSSLLLGGNTGGT